MPKYIAFTPEQVISAFWDKVNKNGSIPQHRPELGNCWEWIAGYRNDYGSFSHNQTMKAAHRFIWEITNGEIPDGLCVLHSCDNRKCVRPDHLFLGTRQDNMDDMKLKNRERHPVGEDHPSHKLTTKQIIEIRQRHKSGLSYRALGREYNINKKHVKDIVTREIWKHVP